MVYILLYDVSTRIGLEFGHTGNDQLVLTHKNRPYPISHKFKQGGSLQNLDSEIPKFRSWGFRCGNGPFPPEMAHFGICVQY